jgi:DNA polymerase-3 subunit gamma/tau
MNLNLARKWRSNTFDHIIGQDLSIRMLKNSLYLQHYFPVYLFSGQRGCGKTTTARVFAAALNCRQLPYFQKNPKEYTIPCLTCDSCIAMQKVNHPDFIEIDAASHTGVDNVRTIIEAASLLPVLGIKKIYLIDEAHMLSKAAFNAFLKILEEPPLNVLFILATTDPHKIIETVKSRCFQLFFPAVTHSTLLDHLKKICDQESINYEDEALGLIIQQSQGSVRDALNIIEQVRFAYDVVSKQAVYTVLGYMSDERLLELMECIFHGSPQDVISWCNSNNLDSYVPEKIWYSFVSLLRALIWCKSGKSLGAYQQHQEQLNALVAQQTMHNLLSCAKLFYDHELLFLKTGQQHHLFETLLLHMAQQLQKKTVTNTEHGVKNRNISLQEKNAFPLNATPSAKIDTRWANFVAHVEQLNEPLITSIFKQGTFVQCNEEAKTVEISFAKDFSFFQEWLDNSQSQWEPLLQSQFGQGYSLTALFAEGAAIKEQKPLSFGQRHENGQASQVPKSAASVSAISLKHSAQPQQNTGVKQNFVKKKQPERVNTLRTTRIDVSDETIWKKTNMILKVFPGTVSEVHEQ